MIVAFIFIALLALSAAKPGAVAGAAFRAKRTTRFGTNCETGF